ncbi:ureidoglycolate lyase [Pararhizobium haloflavum]|uniref:ureidoglycolate lyase n=1 Tax=Pararhizobium haloflavum TaxID=2037914 RepID=UPI000C189067|nr:ureidoglycolate lyase [Pararhizobium haloflavum]
MTRIAIEPLTRKAFAPFGDVIEMEGAVRFPINAGRCTRFHDLARIETAGEGARPIISIVRGEPYDLPLELTMVERHPFGSQAFVPLSDNPFLVVVAEDTDNGPGRLLAFRTAPGQGINIAMNVWHGILTPLGAISDFLVVDRAGAGVNLEEFFFKSPCLVG